MKKLWNKKPSFNRIQPSYEASMHSLSRNITLMKRDSDISEHFKGKTTKKINVTTPINNNISTKSMNKAEETTTEQLFKNRLILKDKLILFLQHWLFFPDQTTYERYQQYLQAPLPQFPLFVWLFNLFFLCLYSYYWGIQMYFGQWSTPLQLLVYVSCPISIFFNGILIFHHKTTSIHDDSMRIGSIPSHKYQIIREYLTIVSNLCACSSLLYTFAQYDPCVLGHDMHDSFIINGTCQHGKILPHDLVLLVLFIPLLYQIVCPYLPWLMSMSCFFMALIVVISALCYFQTQHSILFVILSSIFAFGCQFAYRYQCIQNYLLYESERLAIEHRVEYFHQESEQYSLQLRQMIGGVAHDLKSVSIIIIIIIN